MLPAVTAIQAPVTPTPVIVATPIPGNSTAMRVPSDNVPPTVSNVQINNNARSNGGSIATASAPPQAALPSAAFSSFIPSFDGTPTTLSFGAQMTFLAQLMGQDMSPQAKAVLLEYEKLVQIAQVKYMPSNATLPQPEPANLFGRILQQERLVQPAPARGGAQAAATVQAPAPTLQHASPQAEPPRLNTQAAEAHPASASPVRVDSSPVSPVRAAGAYQSAVSRNELTGQPKAVPFRQG